MVLAFCDYLLASNQNHFYNNPDIFHYEGFYASQNIYKVIIYHWLAPKPNNLYIHCNIGINISNIILCLTPIKIIYKPNLFLVLFALNKIIFQVILAMQYINLYSQIIKVIRMYNFIWETFIITLKKQIHYFKEASCINHFYEKIIKAGYGVPSC